MIAPARRPTATVGRARRWRRPRRRRRHDALTGRATPPRSQDAPAVSLIVCTRDRGPRLPAFLESLERVRSSQPWEAVIVDNGSTDMTWARLTAFAARSRHDVRLVSEPTPGLSAARNTGVRAARGGILAFTDDDCYPSPDLIDAVAAAFADPRLGFMGGQVLLFDPADAPVCITGETRRADFPPGVLISTGRIQGACMAFRREVFAAVGLFDPAFGAGAPLKGAEDCDMVARAGYAGWAGAFVPEAKVFHHHRRRGGAAAAIHRDYDLARGAWFAKLLLRTPGRRLQILRHWAWDTPLVHRPSPRVLGKAWRELRGAGRYLLGHAWAGTPRLAHGVRP